MKRLITLALILAFVFTLGITAIAAPVITVTFERDSQGPMWTLTVFEDGVKLGYVRISNSQISTGSTLTVEIDGRTFAFRVERDGTLTFLGEIGYVHECAPVVYIGTRPVELAALLAQCCPVILSTRGNLGIFAHHSEFIIPEGRTLYIETTLNVQREAELIIEGTVVVLPEGRINNQGNNTSGGTITIADGGMLVNDGYVENVSGSRVFNCGMIINNARFEVRARTVFINGGVVDGTRELNIHRDAIRTIIELAS